MRSYNKILVVKVIILLLVNIALLIFLWKGKQSGDNKHQPSSGNSVETMAKELNMTDSQKTAYQNFRDRYFANTKPIYDSIREARKYFLKMIQSPVVNDSDLELYSNRIAEKQALIDRMTLTHFRNVRAIFSGDQQKKYDDFIQKIFLRKRDSTGKKR